VRFAKRRHDLRNLRHDKKSELESALGGKRTLASGFGFRDSAFAVNIFSSIGLSTSFENLEGFPADWKTNPRPSSSSCGIIIIIRASSNMPNIPTFPQRK